MLQVPPQSTPDLQKPRFYLRKTTISAECPLCSPSGLGLPFGSSWGPLGCLLGPTWHLLGTSWSQLGTSWAPCWASWTSLGIHLGPLGCPLDAQMPQWATFGSNLEPFGDLLRPNGVSLLPVPGLQDCLKDFSSTSYELTKHLPVSTYFLRTPRQLPSPAVLLTNSTSVDGYRQEHASIYIYIYILGIY